MKVLVVYYSFGGMTKKIGDILAAQFSAEVEEVAEIKSRSGIWRYLLSGYQALTEHSSEIHDLRHNPDQYDLIVIGMPNWVSKIPPAIRAYFQKYNLSGKKVALFCTQDSHGEGSVFNDARRAIPNADIITEHFFHKGTADEKEMVDEIAAWAKGIQDEYTKHETEHI